MPAPATNFSPKQYKRAGVPRLNRAHPLAEGLIFYAYDSGDNRAPVDLVAVQRASLVGAVSSVTPSPNGNGFPYSSAATFYSQWATPGAMAIATARGNYTFASQFRKTGTVGQYGKVFTRVANNVTSGPFANWEVGVNPAGLGQSFVRTFFAGSGTNFYSVPGGLNLDGGVSAITDNSLQTIVGVSSGGSNVGAATLTCWVNGALKATVTGATSGSTNVTDPIYLGSNLGIGGGWAGNVYWGAMWGRPLTPAEILQLHFDPYCFLIYPGDSVGVLLNSSSGAGLPIAYNRVHKWKNSQYLNPLA